MKSMSNVDIYAICNELSDFLEGARVDKSFQPTKDTVVMRFHKSGTGRVDVVFQAGVRMHTSQYPLENPTTPPSFPMLLRKRLKGANVVSIKQHNFDRIIELKFKKDKIYTIIIELFDKGNIILLDDEDNIIMPLKRKRLSDRDISSKIEYKYPPKRGINSINLEKDELKKIFKDSETDIVRTLAMNGLGSLYAEEVILKTKNIDKKKLSSDLSDDEIEEIYNSFLEVFKPLKEDEFKPQIIKGTKEDVVPIDLIQYENAEKEYYDSFNVACDEFYSKRVNQDIKGVKEAAWNKKVKKYSKRLKLQKETLQGFEDTIEISQKKGEIIYSNYPLIENVINVVLSARDKQYSWSEISNTLKKAKKEGLNEAQVFESMDKLGNLVLDIENEKISIDPQKTIPENAEIYYEKAKKSKKKIKGALIAIENTEKQLKDITEKKDIAMENIAVPKKRVKKDLKWYEKLRWFITPEDILVISGRDAGTNESIVKKYLDKNDIYLHADIHGASSVVIKLENNSLNDNLLKESAIFAASFSTAWSKGYTTQDVFWVHPDQVSKTPEPGEFLPKGAFIIRGNRNFIRSAKLQIAIGIVNYEGKRVMAGPVESVEAHTDNYIVLKPGYMKKEAIAKKILHKINEDNLLDLDDIVRVLPSGKCDIDEDYHTRKRFENKK
ncbi:NFACT family protein [Methanobrevibacter sp. OttesenSCG-928-K11]|nr:NFACT family protein [Methanobrevibacter sp. OttesenSCG-928-K11]MDL2270277.1 NFACT family protein [Methanobrevibacter sp. OttesenSCG-928-I08]